jgi:hypothetical protein
MEFGPDHPSRYTVAGHDIREMVPQEPRIVPNQVYGSVPPQQYLPPHAYRPTQDQASAINSISRVPYYESLNQRFSQFLL